MANLRCARCGKPITRREKKLNDSLCNGCAGKSLGAIARDLGKKPT